MLNKYLKSCKGRTLSLDEINTIFAIVKALAFTVEQMGRIEGVWNHEVISIGSKLNLYIHHLFLQVISEISFRHYPANTCHSYKSLALTLIR